MSPSPARYDSALAKATDGIWILDANQRFTYANPAACRLLGRRVEELLETPIFRFVPAAEHAQVDAGHAALLAVGTVTCNPTLLRPDASMQTVDVEARTLEDGTCQAFMREVAAEGLSVSEPAASAGEGGAGGFGLASVHTGAHMNAGCQRLKYAASGWCRMIAEVDCSGTN